MHMFYRSHFCYFILAAVRAVEFFSFFFFVDCSTIDLQSLMSLHDSSRRLDRDLFLFDSSLADIFVTSSDRVGSCSQHL